jgi:enoyl-CoA hydratase/carnithine racemase
VPTAEFTTIQATADGAVGHLTLDRPDKLRPFTAAEAQAFGFLNRVVPADEVLATAEELASRLSTKSRLTLTATKRHVSAVLETMSGPAGSWADADGLVAALHDPESREAGAAYLARLRGD